MVLIIEDQVSNSLAVIQPKERKIIWFSGSKVFKDIISKILASNPKLREEIFDPKNDQITAYLKEVRTGDKNFFEALRQEFERQGFWARLISPAGAKLQLALRHSLLSPKLQDIIKYNLPKLADEQINKILLELRSA